MCSSCVPSIRLDYEKFQVSILLRVGMASLAVPPAYQLRPPSQRQQQFRQSAVAVKPVVVVAVGLVSNTRKKPKEHHECSSHPQNGATTNAPSIFAFQITGENYSSGHEGGVNPRIRCLHPTLGVFRSEALLGLAFGISHSICQTAEHPKGW